MKTFRQIIMILSILVMAATAGDGFISTDPPEEIGIFIWQQPFASMPVHQVHHVHNVDNVHP